MRNIVCIGGSTGALDALRALVPGLPADFPAAVFVVRHIAPEDRGLLAEILQPLSALPVSTAVDGGAIQPGRIFIAPADRHLILDRETMHVVHGPRENWARPAIDPLFRTAAQFHGPRTIGVVLSGRLDDGAAGLWALKRRGGFAVVQSPADALAAAMPNHALAAVEADAIATAAEIGRALPRWLAAPADGPRAPDPLADQLAAENRYLTSAAVPPAALDRLGRPVPFVCPDCGGPLWQLAEGPTRYRCHVGHGYSAHTLLDRQREAVEEHGWRLLRALEEERALILQLGARDLPENVRADLHRRTLETRGLITALNRLLQPVPPPAADRSPESVPG